MQDLHGADYDFFRRKSTCGLNSEKEFVVVFTEFGCLLKTVVLRVLLAFLAEAAVISVFDVDDFSGLIERENFPWALLNERSSLLLSEILRDLFLIQLNNWLLSHRTCCYWRPLGMDFTDAFLGNQLEIERLILGQFCDRDCRLLVANFVSVIDWC